MSFFFFHSFAFIEILDLRIGCGLIVFILIRLMMDRTTLFAVGAAVWAVIGFGLKGYLD